MLLKNILLCILYFMIVTPSQHCFFTNSFYWFQLSNFPALPLQIIFTRLTWSPPYLGPALPSVCVKSYMKSLDRMASLCCFTLILCVANLICAFSFISCTPVFLSLCAIIFTFLHLHPASMRFITMIVVFINFICIIFLLVLCFIVFILSCTFHFLCLVFLMPVLLLYF